MKIPFTKYHLQKQYLQSLLLFGILMAITGVMIRTYEYDVTVWIWLIFGFLLLFTIASVALLWKHRSSKNPQVSSSFYDIPVLLEDNGIYFPKGYFFRKSSIAKIRCSPGSH